MLAIFHFLQRLFSFLLVATLLGAPTPSFAILNGQFLRSPEFRWIVSISTGDEGFCTGSLLNAEWVLTSHHCVRDLHEMSVHVVDYPAGFDFERFQDVQALVDTYGAHKAPLISEFIVESALVAEAIVPQEFSDLKDVALLRLQQPVTEVPYFPQVIRPEEAVELRSRGNHDLQVVVAGNGLNGLQGTPYEEGVAFFFRAYYYTDLIPELSAQTTLFSLINPGVERGFYRTDLG